MCIRDRIDDRSAGDVGESCRRLHPAQRIDANEVMCLCGEWAGDQDVVGLFEERLETPVFDTEGQLCLRVAAAAAVEDSHPEAGRAPCDGGSDPPAVSYTH